MKILRSMALGAGITLSVASCSTGSGTSNIEAATDPTIVPTQPSTGSTDPTTEPERTPTGAPAQTEPVVSVLPDVEVVDLSSGETLNLRSFAPNDKPIVLWFWAPH